MEDLQRQYDELYRFSQEQEKALEDLENDLQDQAERSTAYEEFLTRKGFLKEGQLVEAPYGQGGFDFDVLRREHEALQSRYDVVFRENQGYKDDLSRETDLTLKLKKELREEQTKSREFQDAAGELEKDVADLKKQLATHSHALDARQRDEQANKQLLTQKTREISNYLREIEELQTQNNKLTAQNMALTEQFEGLTRENEAYEMQLIELRNSLEAHGGNMDDLQKELQQYKAKATVQERKLKERQGVDDDFMGKVQQQVEVIRLELAQKMEVIRRKDEEIADWKQQVVKLKLEMERESAMHLQALLDDKVRELVQTQDLLQEQQTENELMRDEIVKIKDGMRLQVERATIEVSTKYREALKRVDELEMVLDEHDERYHVLSKQHSKMQKELADCKSRMQEYEREYGLEDAVTEIRELERRVQLRDDDIANLNDTLTMRDKHVQVLYEENQALRIRAGLTEDEVIDLKELRIAQYRELETLRAEKQVMQEQNAVLEDDRVRLQKELLVYAKLVGKRAGELNLNAEHMILAQKLAEGYITEDNLMNSSSARQEAFARLIASMLPQHIVVQQQPQPVQQMPTHIPTPPTPEPAPSREPYLYHTQAMSDKGLQMPSPDSTPPKYQTGVSVQAQPVYQAPVAQFVETVPPPPPLADLMKHLVAALEELQLKDDESEKTVNLLTICMNRVEDMESAQLILYEQHQADVERWEEERKQLQREIESYRTQSKIHGPEVDLARRCQFAEQGIRLMQHRYDAVQKDMMEMSRVARERINALQRSRRESEYASQKLQRELALTVPLRHWTATHAQLCSIRSQFGVVLLELTKNGQDSVIEKIEPLMARLDELSTLPDMPETETELLRRKVQHLEDASRFHSEELERYKTIADIATDQATSLEGKDMDEQTELKGLRAIVHEMHQKATDSDAAIGRLMYEVLQLRVAEAGAQRACEDSRTKMISADAARAKAELAVDERSRLLLQSQDEHRRQVWSMRKQLSEAQERHSGCASLEDLIEVKERITAGEELAVDLRTRIDTMEATNENLAFLNQKLQDQLEETEAQYVSQLHAASEKQIQITAETLLSVQGSGPMKLEQYEEALKILGENQQAMLADRTSLAQTSAHLDAANRKLQYTEEVVAQKDKRIAQLEEQLSKVERPRAGLDSAQEKALQAAEHTVNTLQGLLRKKEDDLRDYQRLLDESRLKLMEEAKNHADQLQILNEQLSAGGDLTLTKLNSALEDIERPQQFSHAAALRTMEENLMAKERTINSLQVQLEAARLEVEKKNDQLVSHISEQERLRTDVKSLRMPQKEMDRTIREVKRSLRQKEVEMEALKKVIITLKEDLVRTAEQYADRDGADVSETAMAKLSEQQKRVETLQQRYFLAQSELTEIKQREETNQRVLAEKHEELKKYKALIANLQQKIIDLETLLATRMSSRPPRAPVPQPPPHSPTRTGKPLPPRPDSASSKENDEDGGRRKEKKERSGADSDSDSSNDNPDTEHGVVSAEISAKATEAMKTVPKDADELRDRLHLALEELLLAKQNEESVRDAMEAQKQKAKAIIADLRARVSELEKQSHNTSVSSGGRTVAKRSALAPKSPTQQDHDVSTTGAVEKWEAEKRAQQKAELTKAKLAKMTQSYDELQKKTVNMQTTINSLESELKALRAEYAEHSTIKASTKQTLEQVRDLKERIYKLEEANGQLERVVQVEKDSEIRKLRFEKKQLADRALELEKERALADIGSLTDPTALQAEITELKAQVNKLTENLMEKDNLNMELRFDKEMNSLQISRLKKKIADLETYMDAMNAGRPLTLPSSAGIIAPLSKKAKEKEVQELNDVIEALKRVIEKLRTENASLKKNTQSNVKYMELLKESRAMKQHISDLEVQLAEAQKDGGFSQATLDKIQKLQLEIDKLKRSLKNSTEQLDVTKAQLADCLLEKDRLQSELNEAMAVAVDHQRETVLDSMRQTRMLQDLVTQLQAKVETLEAEIDRRGSLIADLQSQITSAGGHYPERDTSVRRDSTSEMGSDVRVLQKRIAELLKNKSALEHQLQAVRVSIGERSKLRGSNYADLVKSHERLLSENAELMRELNAFDPQFFEELEDLKFEYREAVKKNEAYEKQLSKLATKYNFVFDPIPSAR